MRLFVFRHLIAGALIATTVCPISMEAQQPAQLEVWKSELADLIEGRRQFTANMGDQIFSYGELGFQEFETSRYLVDLLRDNVFTV